MIAPEGELMAEDHTPAGGTLIEDGAVKRLLRWMPFAMLGHLVIGAPTLIISLIVAYGTYVQAQATQRMQQAAAWPYLAYDTSNYSDDGKHRISLRLTNNGVGPALLGPIELSFGGRVVRSPDELLKACCGYRTGQSLHIATAPPSNVALRPGETITFFELRPDPVNAPLIPRMDRIRHQIRMRSCYCSIFEECWTIAGVQAKPKPVDACPADWTVYRER
jgi:hypothetical protein